MSETQPPAPPAPSNPPDTWTLRVTTLTAAAAFLAGTGALIWVMVFGEPQMASIAMGFVGGTLVGAGASFFMRGRIENPAQARSGTGDGGQGQASVSVQNADVVNARPPGPDAAARSRELLVPRSPKPPGSVV